MPLIVMCGIPGSGKTTRAEDLKAHFTSKGHSVILISDSALAPSKSEVYATSQREKEFRALLKSTVERELSPTKVVILDWLNYIKGYRYELFCLARNVQTTVAVVFCEVNGEDAVARTTLAEPLFRDLASRMETPNAKNRWDSPLFIVRLGEATPCEEVERAILEGKLPRPPVATKQTEQVQGDYLYQLDQTTQLVAEDVLTVQDSYDLGTEVTLPRAAVPYVISRKLTSLELKRARAQFIKMSRMRPCPAAAIPSAFADFVQNCHSDAF